MEQIAAYISLFGVVLIARPTSLLSFSSSSSGNAPAAGGTADLMPPLNETAPVHAKPDASNYDNVTPAQRAAGVGVALLGVVGAAIA